MMTRIILYGWVASWLCLFAGAWKLEAGDWLAGSLLCAVWFAFSWLVILNEGECLREAERFEAWMDRLLGGVDNDKNHGLGFN